MIIEYLTGAAAKAASDYLKFPWGLWHNFGGVDVLENGRAMLRYAFDQGITHFDLANNYGPPPGIGRRDLRGHFKERFSSVQGMS